MLLFQIMMRFESQRTFQAATAANTTVRTSDNETRVVILGAGPAGLTAAYELSNSGTPCVVLEQDAVVGGRAPLNTKDSASTSEGIAFIPKCRSCNRSGVTFSARTSLLASVFRAF